KLMKKYSSKSLFNLGKFVEPESPKIKLSFSEDLNIKSSIEDFCKNKFEIGLSDVSLINKCRLEKLKSRSTTRTFLFNLESL
ncbi:MAG: hypothetical protein NC905_01145, partial [Candidatus Omnitrophica bacterium]|nr:hypothetical protein [Candidatus Omnitrophota bacterium]